VKDNFFVIKPNGDIVPAASYHSHSDASDNFRVLLSREVSHQDVARGSVGKPAYLAVAKKFGFNWEPNADVGMAQYDFKAALMHRLVQEYARMLVSRVGLPLYEVMGANMFNLDHPVVDAYAKLYGDRLYRFNSGVSPVMMSYDASYPQFNLASSHVLSHKSLPAAHFSIADCYRHEQSGECMLLYRQRRFFMPDVHPYFKDVAEAFDWFPKLEAQILAASQELGRNYEMVIEVASPELWNQYRCEIKAIASRFGRDVLVCVINDGLDRYWILNVDYKIIDALEQSREIACIQIDVGNAPRLGIEYIAADGQIKHPVIIHSAIPGGIERYLYMALDNFSAGLPLWLYPVQIRLVPVSDEYVGLCQKLLEQAAGRPARIEIDNRPHGVGKKIRQARIDLVPYAVVIGEKEMKGSQELDRVISLIEQASDKRPYLPRSWPARLASQIH
jgi:threonyl-tRNA synthetase